MGSIVLIEFVVTGPTTLAAILNSLHMGFRTLAIQQRNIQVWKVLSEVKKEKNISPIALEEIDHQ